MTDPGFQGVDSIRPTTCEAQRNALSSREVLFLVAALQNVPCPGLDVVFDGISISENAAGASKMDARWLLRSVCRDPKMESTFDVVVSC